MTKEAPAPSTMSESNHQNRIVQKFGGSSVADAQKIRKVAARVAASKAEGHQLVVVVSAQGDTTDELLGKAKALSSDPPKRELDMLLSCGERISMALLSICLNQLGVAAVSLTGSQSGIITDQAHASARIIEIRPTRIEAALSQGLVVIVAGYQGVSVAKEVTTLGRGGSDTTAVALAAALGADCEIYSDVDGVYSADPRVVPSARRLASLSYDEMIALASAGAKVLNAQAVEFAKARDIVISAKLAHGEGQGTRIEASASGASGVKSVAVDVAIWVLEAEAPLMLLQAVERAGLRVRTLSSDLSGKALLTLSVADIHNENALLQTLSAHGLVRTDLAQVSCIGTNLSRDARVVRFALQHARETGFQVESFSGSTSQWSFLVGQSHAALLAKALHREFIEG